MRSLSRGHSFKRSSRPLAHFKDASPQARRPRPVRWPCDARLENANESDARDSKYRSSVHNELQIIRRKKIWRLYDHKTLNAAAADAAAFRLMTSYKQTHSLLYPGRHHTWLWRLSEQQDWFLNTAPAEASSLCECEWRDATLRALSCRRRFVAHVGHDAGLRAVTCHN